MKCFMWSCLGPPVSGCTQNSREHRSFFNRIDLLSKAEPLPSATVLSMIAPMALRHRIIGLIWAAVLVIAVQFVPSIASAHSGHEHHAARLGQLMLRGNAAGSSRPPSAQRARQR